MALNLASGISNSVVSSTKIVQQLGAEVWKGVRFAIEYLWLTTGRGKPYERSGLPTFSKRTPLHDVALVFDEGELWFSRQILSIHSPYLNARLNPTPSKSKSSAPQSPIDRLPIKGASYQDVLSLLRCLTPGETFMHLDMSNVLALGRAANALEILEVTKRCKRYLVEQSSTLIHEGDARLIDLLVIVGQLGYRPLLDFLIVKGAEMMSFDEIRKRYKDLPPKVVVALYDLKLSSQARQSHSWKCSPVKPDEFCDCGDDPIDVGHRCQKCKKICCNRCFRKDGVGARGKCSFCSDCNGKIEFSTANSECQSDHDDDLRLEKLCVCSPKISPGLLD